ncbi:hypothetical protein LHJ74_28370 [Streptomyces sp. N2-109]|uniref:Nucleopolyhedrovirus P10 family protein n=1 Tax=Streptomyces gossypii TaxID=2883101 RepID=A0ABT2K0S0_9ACTN|nr:hypothetical protein [Streptomyces gossypii]MCT2593774.1 hypothetical protein [Streptomyces gossypii]
MGTDPLTEAVRRQVALGRLVPLGGADDGAWITEQAAAGVLRGAAAGLGGVRPGRLRLAPAAAGPSDAPPHGAPEVPPPPGALPHGPLRLSADFEAPGNHPLRPLAERLRAALYTAATERLGLTVSEVDLRVTGLLEAVTGAEEQPELGPEEEREAEPAVARAGEPGPGPGQEGPDPTAEAVAHAALGAPGVAGLAPVLGAHLLHTYGSGDHAVHLVEIATAANHRALDVARGAREAVIAAVREPTEPGPGPFPARQVAVAVLVTAIRRAAPPPSAAHPAETRVGREGAQSASPARSRSRRP